LTIAQANTKSAAILVNEFDASTHEGLSNQVYRIWGDLSTPLLEIDDR